MANFAVLALVLYVKSFAEMTKRKDAQQIRLIEIDQYMKHIPIIQEQIVDDFVTASGKVRKVLSKNLERITLVNSLETTMYDETIMKHQLLQEILHEFYPEGITDIWGKKSCETEWEELQTLDLEK